MNVAECEFQFYFKALFRVWDTDLKIEQGR